MKSLQNKIFLFFVILLLVVQAIAFWTIFRATRNQERQQIKGQLDLASTIFKNRFEDRSFFLDAFAQTAAKDWGLKSVFADDLRSFLQALNNHKKRIDADIAIAINKEGTITGELVNKINSFGKPKTVRGAEMGQKFRFENWLTLSNDANLYPVDDHIYQLSLAPLKSGAETVGWVGFGYEIDQKLAEEFSRLTGLSTGFVTAGKGEHQLLAVSESEILKNELIQPILSGSLPKQFIGTHVPLGEINDINLVAVLLGSRADLLAAIQQRGWQLLGLASLTLLMSLAGAFFIAKGITRPVKKLVDQAKFISQGNYDQSVEIQDSSELGQLANEFNQMQQAVLTREQKISHRAYHDPLTDLPNRNRLMVHLDGLVERNVPGIALFLVNVRHIKTINNTLGHDVGDEVIKYVGLQLAKLGDASLLCHLGADEFVIVKELDGEDQIKAVIEEIIKIFEKPYNENNITLFLQTRTGVALYPEHAKTGYSQIQKADTALHLARQANMDYQVYDSALDFNTVKRLNLISDLKTAIEKDQLILFYQPKLNLKSMQVTHLEALIRWKHPRLGMVPPDEFISIAEQTGQINPMTDWVLNEAGRQYREWEQQGIKLSIATNISAGNLKDENFYETVQSVRKKYSLPIDALTLEITESAVVENPEFAIKVLTRFKEQGIKLSIDDYGTGYSSLAQLKDLPVHELKIDKSFVERLPDDEDDKIIVRSTIELAHNMGLTIVAEGIETKPAMNWLQDSGCEYAQGYFISKPLPGKEFEKWLLASDYFTQTRETNHS